MKGSRSVGSNRSTTEIVSVVSADISHVHGLESESATDPRVDRLEAPAPDRLTQKEKKQLEHCEQILHRGLGTFFEVGKALLAIREMRLYRATHASFDAYCKERWGIGRSYAGRVIGAAERLRLLPVVTGARRPANEFQMRPFLRLEPTAFPKVWEEVLKRAADGSITSHLIQSVINGLSALGSAALVRASSAMKTRPRNARLGQVIALLHEAKRKVEKGEADNALEVLEKVEALLCAS